MKNSALLYSAIPDRVQWRLTGKLSTFSGNPDNGNFKLSAHNLSTHLERRFHPTAAQDMDLHITLEWPGGSFAFVVRDGQFLPNPGDMPTELVVYGRSEAGLRALLTGQANPVDAFMAGELRSNGYLMWVFRVLALFRSSGS